ncbi:MAG: hypothetical protein V2G42_01590 [bacterium JZ-2024 1]
MNRRIILIILICLLPPGVAIYYGYHRPIVRPLQVGDSFTFVDRNGDAFVVSVHTMDPVTGNLALEGTSPPSAHPADFYSFLAIIRQSGRYLEILHISLDEPRDACLVKRGVEGRGALLFPIKWTRSRPSAYGFRVSCEIEGSFLMRGEIQSGKWESLTVPAGSFRVRYVRASAGFGLSSDDLGSMEMWVASKLGFPVKVSLVAEGRRYELILTQYTLARPPR